VSHECVFTAALGAFALVHLFPTKEVGGGGKKEASKAGAGRGIYKMEKTAVFIFGKKTFPNEERERFFWTFYTCKVFRVFVMLGFRV